DRDAFRPERLEEGGLGLDGDGDLGDRLDDAAAELLARRDRVVTPNLSRQPVEHRIETHAERRPLALHGGSEPIPEMTRLAHASQDKSSPGRRGRPEAASRSSEEISPFAGALASRTTSA